MDLTVRDLAELLNVSERTVQSWIENRGLPAHRLHEQYRLNRVELQEWADEHGVSLPPELFAAPRAAPEGLLAAIERGGVHYGVSGSNRSEVLRSVASLPTIPDSIDRSRLHQLLVSREVLSSTGFGGGIAIPHPRNPLVLRVPHSLALVCFLAAPVDFEAIDGKPVRVLFPLLSPNVKAHLRLLSEVSHALHDKGFRRHIEDQAPVPAILERLRAVESKLRVPKQNGHPA